MEDVIQLNIAVISQDLEKARQLLCNKHVDPNVVIKTDGLYEYKHMLIDACENLDLDMVQLLISNPEHPADPNIADSKYDLPIWIAVSSQNVALTRLLLNESLVKVDVNCYIEQYGTPLLWAVLNQDLDIVQELVKPHVDADLDLEHLILNEDVTHTPLMLAVITSNLEICRALLEAGCKVNLADLEGETALHLAVPSSKNREIADLLINYRANICAKNKSGETPLVLTFNKDDVGLLRKFLNEIEEKGPHNEEIQELCHKFVEVKLDDKTLPCDPYGLSEMIEGLLQLKLDKQMPTKKEAYKRKMIELAKKKNTKKEVPSNTDTKVKKVTFDVKKVASDETCCDPDVEVKKVDLSDYSADVQGTKAASDDPSCDTDMEIKKVSSDDPSFNPDVKKVTSDIPSCDIDVEVKKVASDYYIFCDADVKQVTSDDSSCGMDVKKVTSDDSSCDIAIKKITSDDSFNNVQDKKVAAADLSRNPDVLVKKVSFDDPSSISTDVEAKINALKFEFLLNSKKLHEIELKMLAEQNQKLKKSDEMQKAEVIKPIKKSEARFDIPEAPVSNTLNQELENTSAIHETQLNKETTKIETYKKPLDFEMKITQVKEEQLKCKKLMEKINMIEQEYTAASKDVGRSITEQCFKIEELENMVNTMKRNKPCREKTS